MAFWWDGGCVWVLGVEKEKETVAINIESVEGVKRVKRVKRFETSRG